MKSQRCQQAKILNRVHRFAKTLRRGLEQEDASDCEGILNVVFSGCFVVSYLTLRFRSDLAQRFRRR